MKKISDATAETAGQGPLVTVVMAAYNSEKYISRAINSILDQDIEGWELICIDDGSTDNTYDILTTFAEHEPRIRLFQQKNMGPEAARHVGYTYGEGDYYIIVDSDDWVERGFLSSLLAVAAATDADAVMSDFSQAVDGYWTSFSEAKGLRKGDVYSGLQAFELTFPWQVNGVCLWRANLIKGYGIDPLDAQNPFNGDEFLTRKLFLHSNKVVFGPGKYFYEHNPNSLTKLMSHKHFYHLETDRRLTNLARSANVPKNVLQKVISHEGNGIISRVYSLARFGSFGKPSLILRELRSSMQHFVCSCAATQKLHVVPGFIIKVFWQALKGFFGRSKALQLAYKKLRGLG